jgi:hypothetical protein
MSDTAIIAICVAAVAGLALILGRGLRIKSGARSLETKAAGDAPGQTMEARGGGSIKGALQMSGGGGHDQAMRVRDEGTLEDVAQIDLDKKKDT